jgi:para-nitrobenzyl esterase
MITTEPVVTTTSGQVRGALDRGVARFLGIPYAAAPFGEHRFRAPAPVTPWSGIRDALEFGPTAPKPGYPAPIDQLLPEPSTPGDDCLNLNVWTPDPAATGLPVIVWIHGGSLRNGSNQVSVYDGHSFARDGVVLVSINYRLGVEGFGVFPDAPHNRGLLDQIAALEWVRANIAAFGGNPDNVTVCGQSAGAISIGALLASPRTHGLFRRAVMQSGPALAVETALASKLTAAIAKRLGVEPTAAAFAAVDRKALLAAQVAAQAGGSALDPASAFSVVIDGDVVPVDPQAALTHGAAADIDLLLGYTSDEYRLWFIPSGIADRISGLTLRLALLKFKIKGKVRKGYQQARPQDTAGEILGRIAGDRLLVRPAYELADSRAGNGNTFMYEFAWRTPVQRLDACHALDIGFVFDAVRDAGAELLAGPDAPQSLADAMHPAWVAFATTGRPGWDAYDSSRPVMIYDLPAPRLDRNPQAAMLKAWS